jgi:hypothetical protein
MSLLSLGPYTRHQLEKIFNTTLDRHRDCCQAILTADRGQCHAVTAEALTVRPRTPQHWLNASRAQGLDGLRIHWADGRAPPIPEALTPRELALNRPRSPHRPLYARRGGLSGAGGSSTDSRIATNIERGF